MQFFKTSYNKKPPKKIFKYFYKSLKGKPLNLRIPKNFAKIGGKIQRQFFKISYNKNFQKKYLSSFIEVLRKNP